MALTGYGCTVRGTGAAFGSREVGSTAIEQRLGLMPGWVVDRTGVAKRFVVVEGERTLQLATRAGQQALEAAGVAPRDLDLVICATMTAEMPCPATSHRLVHELGATPCGGFDLTSACTGFLAAMHLAANGIRAGVYRHVLVVGSDVLTPTIDPEDHRMICLFGDAAGAAVLSRSDDPEVGCLTQMLGSDGSHWDAVYQPRCAEDLPPNAPEPKQYNLLIMNGMAVFQFAVSTLAEIIPQTLQQVGMTLQDADLVLLHQSNLRIIATLRDQLGLDDVKCPAVIQHTGNTSGGSVGVLLDTVRRDGRLKPGMTVVLAAVGGGLSWGASVWRV